MAFDEGLAARLREQLKNCPGVSERKMFGGLAFLLNGHMVLGVQGDTLMVRVGPLRYADALHQPHARAMDFTGRPMMGYVFVAAPGIASDEALRQWIEWCVAFVATLPPK